MRNPLFIFFVVLLVVGALGLVVSLTHFNQPTDDVYYNTSSSINQTQGFIVDSLDQSVSWALPAVLVACAVGLIGILALIGKGRR